jgi:hypothetical protein
VKLVATVELHEREEVPEPVTLLGLIVAHDRPLGTASVSTTIPVNPFMAVTVMVETVD